MDKKYNILPTLQASATGQALVIPLSVTRSSVRDTLKWDELETVAVIKPKYRRVFVQFAGGMREQGDSLEETAVRELEEETNISADIHNLVPLHKTEKKRIDGTGMFPVVLFVALGCDLSTAFDPERGQYGNDRELTIRLRLGSIVQGARWSVPGNFWRKGKLTFLPEQFRMIQALMRVQKF